MFLTVNLLFFYNHSYMAVCLSIILNARAIQILDLVCKFDQLGDFFFYLPSQNKLVFLFAQYISFLEGKAAEINFAHSTKISEVSPEHFLIGENNFSMMWKVSWKFSFHCKLFNERFQWFQPSHPCSCEVLITDQNENPLNTHKKEAGDCARAILQV